MNRGSMVMCFLVFYFFVYLKCPVEPLGWQPGPLTPLTPNYALSNASLLFKGLVSGPDSYLNGEDGYIYMGDANGRILKFEGTKPKKTPRLVTFTGRPHQALPLPCGTYTTEQICGRPMGMDIDGKGKLLVADAYMGLMNVDQTRENSFRTLTTRASRATIAFPSDVVTSKRGGKKKVYFTDASDYKRRDTVLSLLEARPKGRVIMYDTGTKKSKAIVTNLYFPNGILLSKGEDYILVAETGRNRIKKYILTGEHKKTEEVWSDNLPCSPSKLSWLSDAHTDILVACYAVRDWKSELLATQPLARVALLKTMTPSFIHDWVFNTEAMVLKLGTDGKVKGHYMDPTGSISSLSSAVAIDEYVYLGSTEGSTKSVARVPLSVFD